MILKVFGLPFPVLYTFFTLSTLASREAGGRPSSSPLSTADHLQNLYPVCDIALDSTICLFNQDTILLPEAQPYGIVGHYTFDHTMPTDSSGLRNHALGNFVAGPSPGGSSALFRKNYILIPHSESFKTQDYSVSFWLYRLEDDASSAFVSALKQGDLWCPSMYTSA